MLRKVLASQSLQELSDLAACQDLVCWHSDSWEDGKSDEQQGDHIETG